MEESEFRRIVQETVDSIRRAVDDLDPDLAEAEESHGALSIRLADGTRCIISAQPSVRQLWLAVAAQGAAFHFDWDVGARRWIDDKGRGIELKSYLSSYLKEITGQMIEI